MTNHAARVLNLISLVNLKTAPPKKWAVIKLLQWQPEARKIRFDRQCPNRRCKSELMMTYTLPSLTNREKNPARESCGVSCPICGFSGSSSRLRDLQAKEAN